MRKFYVVVKCNNRKCCGHFFGTDATEAIDNAVNYWKDFFNKTAFKTVKVLYII